MGFNQKVREQARTDSRRFSKGTVCRLLHSDQENGSKIIDILIRYSLVPTSASDGFITYQAGDKVAYCTKSGRAFVMPLNEYVDLQALLKEIDLAASQPTSTGEETSYDVSDVQAVAEAYSRVVSFIKQNMIMVRLPYIRSQAPDPTKHDVLVETIDLSQTIDGYLVDKSDSTGLDKLITDK